MNKTAAEKFYNSLKDDPQSIVEWCMSEIKEYEKLISLIRKPDIKDGKGIKKCPKCKTTSYIESIFGSICENCGYERSEPGKTNRTEKKPQYICRMCGKIEKKKANSNYRSYGCTMHMGKCDICKKEGYLAHITDYIGPKNSEEWD